MKRLGSFRFALIRIESRRFGSLRLVSGRLEIDQ